MNTLPHDTIADFFIDFSQNHGDCLTNLKLQKLVYYAQAWYLGINGSSLIESDFQAWVHGPVCPSLYRRFKKYGWNPISEHPEEVSIPDNIREHLTEVFDVYGQYSGYQLEQMTHAESPWMSARGDIPLDDASNAIISKQSMQDFYSELAEA